MLGQLQGGTVASSASRSAWPAQEGCANVDGRSAHERTWSAHLSGRAPKTAQRSIVLEERAWRQIVHTVALRHARHGGSTGEREGVMDSVKRHRGQNWHTKAIGNILSVDVQCTAPARGWGLPCLRGISGIHSSTAPASQLGVAMHR